ncbi:adventurous gliding motility protein AgmC [Archangium primigenium]|uniref:adventurous gliding motility protein AgmC n=1 Tax=[Archangium] primigenium TaxID=2792470 RepID=UPI00195E9EBE|nr:Ig-like domain-containing protein [Archangium primigenium]MBM7114811.1 hypothetical protein [Archangium primigenium]
MRTPFTRKGLPLVGLLVLGSTGASAGPDTVGVGSGRNGALTVSANGTLVNAYAPLTAPVARKALALPVGPCVGNVSGACFAEGDLVLVFQTTGLTPPPVSGDRAALELSASAVGRWEFARVTAVTPTSLGLSVPLVRDYPVAGTQVIRVPEYTTVTVAAGASITASPWNGGLGGVVALLATGTVENQGTISADIAGFRGGQYVAKDLSARGCSGLDEGAAGGAQKGEGLAGPDRYGSTQTGRGNVANGAGGAVCFRSGGGGGGNGGEGGQGGRTDATDGSRDVGGLGGAALVADPLTQLLLGGGGGAGHGTSASGVGGGVGGGAVFLRATQLTGPGSLSASGGSGGTVQDGGSGGGAGGALYVRIVRTAGCGISNASGGIGSTSSSPRVGPGGGGGGGRVLFQSEAGATCDLLSTGASSGGQQVPADGSYGAQAGSSSTPTQYTYGFIIPEAPVVTAPASGLYTNNPRPRITGSAPVYPQRAPALTEVILLIDGEEVGRVTTAADGSFSFDLPQDLAEGAHTVRAVTAVDAVQSLESNATPFIVDITPPETQVSGPRGAIQDRNPRVEYGANEEGVTYTCSLDGGEFVPCPADGVFADLPDGPHSVQVRARDRAGNEDPRGATLNFIVAVADRALLGDGLGCSATGGGGALFGFGLSALTLALRRRRREHMRNG